MTIGACTELSHYLAVAPVRPNSGKCNGAAIISRSFRHAIGGYNGVLSMSRSKREENRVVAGVGDQGLTYRDAGVDIDAGSELVRRIAKMAPGIGGFGGLFPLGRYFYFYFHLRFNHLCFVPVLLVLIRLRF